MRKQDFWENDPEHEYSPLPWYMKVLIAISCGYLAFIFFDLGFEHEIAQQAKPRVYASYSQYQDFISTQERVDFSLKGNKQ